jgi:hypothetical protein
MLSLLFLGVARADAQISGDLNIGFGIAHLKAGGSGIDNTNSTNAFGSCLPGSGDPFCEPAPGWNGFLLGFGGDIMATKRLGIGGEVNFMPSASNDGPSQFRETFYDFNGIFAPVNEKVGALKFMGGIGGAKTAFVGQNSCAITCPSSSQFIGAVIHFQFHAGARMELFLNEHLFVAPQFDFRYVPNLTNQFGSSVVLGGMFWLGYRTSAP